MKKLLCLLLTAALLCSAVPVFAEEASDCNLTLAAPKMAAAEKSAVCAVSASSADAAEEVESIQFEGGDGSKNTPYQIATLAQLEEFGRLVNSGKNEICAVLVNDIVINEDPEAAVNAGETENLLIFAPIATDVVYNGTFDGNGFSITGLYCDLYLDQEELEDAYYYYSLFGQLGDQGTIKNVTLDKVYLSASVSKGHVLLGGLVAFSEGLISACSADGNILVSSMHGDMVVGGICGAVVGDNFLNQESNSITECENYCTLNLMTTDGAVTAGGICASVYIEKDFVNDCINYGNIDVGLLNHAVSDSEYNVVVGGVFGHLYYDFFDLFNLGHITVTTDKENYHAIVGGAVGLGAKLKENGEIDRCITGYSAFNLADIDVVAGSALVGGVFGYSNGPTFSYNRGCLSATCIADDSVALVGGISGYLEYLSQGYNCGTITAQGKSDSLIGAGGIAGELAENSTVVECYNLGKISASGSSSASVKAISAYNYSKNSYYDTYALKGAAPIDEGCVALTQEEFKTICTTEEHPEWDYAPLFHFWGTPYQETPFCDTHPLSWYYDASVYAYQNKLMNGISMTEFAPDLSVTRAMFVTVLYRLAGSEDVSALSNRFADIEADAWYTDAVIWAANNGIVNGITETTFCPQDNITREQIATILYRYVTEYLGQTAELSADLSTYPDSGSVSAYAQDAMTWAVGAGLITGTQKGDQTLLDPQGLATRAQMATILMRALENGTL